MTKEDCIKIIDLAYDKMELKNSLVLEHEFISEPLEKLGYKTKLVPEYTASLFNIAIMNEDSELLECVWTLCVLGMPKNIIEIVLGFINEDWHNLHEDLALFLQGQKNPIAVNALVELTKKEYDYLSYDELYGLARKCTWALADIGTNEAKMLYIKFLNLKIK